MTTLKEFISDKEFVWGFIRKHKVSGSQPVRFKPSKLQHGLQNGDVFVGVRLQDLNK